MLKFKKIFLASLVLSFLVFGNGISGEFVFDDVTVIQNRPDVKDARNFFNLFVSPYHQNMPKTGLYRPFTMTSYAINHYINDSPAGFHIVNIIIHALNSFLVFCLVNYLFKNKFLSYAVFLLFLTHPIHTEAVTSIVGRAELWAFFWSLITIHFYIKKKTVLSLTSFLLALLSKEIAITILPVIFYIDWVLVKNKLFLSVRRMSFFALPLGVYMVLRYIVLGRYFVEDAVTTLITNPLKFAPLGERLITAINVLYLYVEKLIWPVRLSADYSYNSIPVISNPLNPYFLFGIVFLSLLLFLLFYKKTNKTELGLGSVFFLFPYLMISNLIKPVGTIMGERLMYLPSLGFILIISCFLSKSVHTIGKKFAYAILILIVTLYGARTITRNKDWHDARTLFTATVDTVPDSLVARAALAAVHIKADEWKEAREQLDIARNIHENNSRIQNLLGIVADHDGNYRLAEERYKKSLELNP
ncbi:MAG: repeat-containing protein, partial [Microgenomates group bacterium GW2011_GWC1_43_11]